ncbi:type VII secretion protein EccE [Mycolicibacter longobardus]|uniref:Type VII secretion protein EccE n=1 Tax=Mycolicibacter longobardus TaxID=1108812 RepID=A0A1X1YS36_9MYCO|nr:type VII secretion protein EccE [Mycolicibacter longobardus]MCV7383380.1 type VII secretion protein EccE [Mycolicibacter longobardus]ORW13830.1 type VII secretion protein EccE [Mycolicibacter longobardus]
MRAQHTFGLNLSWMRVTTVFLIDIGILWLAGHWPAELGAANRAWWPAVGLAAVLTTAALITHRRVPLTAILVARLLDRFATPEAFLTEGCTAGVDHRRRYSRDVVGMREYRGRLVSVIAIPEQPAEPAGRHRRGPVPAPTLPAEVVAAGLRQFDVQLDGIDVVSVRTCDSPADGEPADDTTPASVPHTAGPRDTWVILRMDPMSNADAVAVRDSVAATLAAATERLAHDLAEHHLLARVLSAEEFDQVDAAVLAGLQPSRIRRRRRRLKQKERKGPKQYAATFWMSPRDITSANLERLWLPETDTTAVTVRLARRHHRTEVAVLVRYHSASRLPRKNTWAGLNRLNGRQLTALRTSLPTPMRRTLAVPARELNGQDSLQLPLGADARGPHAQQPLARVRIPA